MKVSQLLEFSTSDRDDKKSDLKIWFKKTKDFNDAMKSFEARGDLCRIGYPTRDGYQVLEVTYGSADKMNDKQLIDFILNANDQMNQDNFGFYF